MNDSIKDRIETIRERAPIVAEQQATYDESFAAEMVARRTLLDAVLEVAEPALEALSSKLKVSYSRVGCVIHGREVNHIVHGDLRGIQILPSIALVSEGEGWAWYMDRETGHTCEVMRCAVYAWERVEVEDVLGIVPLFEISDGIAQAIEEQLGGGKVRKSMTLDNRARKLRALATLVGAGG